LKVDKQTIEFRSDKKTLVIPVQDIQSVTMHKMTSDFNQADTNLWGIVRFGVAGSVEVAGFREGHWGDSRETERIYLTLRSVLQSRPGLEASGDAKQASLGQPKQEDSALEEQVIVNFDQRKWRLANDAEKGGQRVKEFVLPEETVDNWTELVTLQVFSGAQKRTTAEEMVLGLKQQQLSECPKGMWKTIRSDNDGIFFEWQTVDCHGWDNQYEVAKVIRGRTAIHRVAYTNRKLPVSEATRLQWIDLIGKASLQAPGPTTGPTTEPSQPSPPSQERKTETAAQPPVSSQAGTADALPEGFVVYEGQKGQFTIGIPKDWMGYDQGQMLKTAGSERMASRFGIIFFLPSKDFTSETGGSGMASPQLMRKIDTGEIIPAETAG
jgi:hypothetical protein